LREEKTEQDAYLAALVRKGKLINLWDFRNKAGTAAFMRRYQNEVVDPDTQKFPEVWFTGGKDDWAPPEGYPGCFDRELSLGDAKRPGWRYVTGVDPAAGIKTQSSVRFACVTLAMDPEEPQYTYLVDIDYGQYPLDSDNPDKKTQVNVVLNHVDAYGSRVILETNNIQGVYDGVLRRAARERGMLVTITGHYTSKGKKIDPETGVEAMQPMVENGFLRLPAHSASDRKKVQELVNEFTLLGVYGTTDILYAFWFAWRALERYRVKTAVKEADHVEMPAYMMSQTSWDFPPQWSQEQRLRFLGLAPPAEEEDFEEEAI
jgi:hypothetical protein